MRSRCLRGRCLCLPCLTPVPTPDVSLDCARHQPRPLPLPGRWTGVGEAGRASARAGDIGGVTSSVAGMYRLAIIATVGGPGGTNVEHGLGVRKAGTACARSLGAS